MRTIEKSPFGFCFYNRHCCWAYIFFLRGCLSQSAWWWEAPENTVCPVSIGVCFGRDMGKVLVWKTVCSPVTSASGELGRDRIGGCHNFGKKPFSVYSIEWCCSHSVPSCMDALIACGAVPEQL